MRKIIIVMLAVLMMAVGAGAVHSMDDNKGRKLANTDNVIQVIAAVHSLDDNKGCKSVLTSLQATYSLTARLCRGTAIKVENLFPQGVSMKSQQYYIRKHIKELAKPLSHATAVVTIRSAWPGDPLFPAARGEKISTIEIDASMPLDIRQSGVALLNVPKNGESSMEESCLKIWLSLANASRMAEIIAIDLQRLSFGDRAVIGRNLMELKQEMFKLRSGYETRFARLDSLEVIAMTGEFVYLTDNFNIEVVGYFLKPEIDWTENDFAAFEQAILDSDIKVVIHKWEPDKAIMDLLRKTGVRLVVLDPMDAPAGNDDALDVDVYLKTMKQNLATLAAAL
ncbi:MAG: zinc ABC transporter substrate-binding protein [Desulfobacterium sp.]|nr:zinc ABC transporter substrate-binding protein [Desulfobacterium sp.]